MAIDETVDALEGRLEEEAPELARAHTAIALLRVDNRYFKERYEETQTALALTGEAMALLWQKLSSLAHDWHHWPDPTRWPGDQGLPVALEAFQIADAALKNSALKRAMRLARSKRKTP